MYKKFLFKDFLFLINKFCILEDVFFCLKFLKNVEVYS